MHCEISQKPVSSWARIPSKAQARQAARCPLLFLHGIRGSRLAIQSELGPRIIWQLADEENPLGHLMALHHDGEAPPRPVDPARPVFPLDLEPDVHGRFVEWARARGELFAPVWDWRLPPSAVVDDLAVGLPAGELDVVVHSMGLHILAELVARGLLPLERVRRLALVAPAFGGALDILHVLLSGCDREYDGADATGRSYGSAVRGLPALYHLLPVPGHGLLQDAAGQELDPLELERWPLDGCVPGEQQREILGRLLARARHERGTLQDFARTLPSLGMRLRILAGCGVPTPALCRMDGPGMSCASSHVEMRRDGDGRLALSAQLPLGFSLPHRVFGDEGDPVAHGEILRRPEVLACLASFLDS